MNANEDWYYFNESDKKLKTGWHHDGADGYWYYLDPSNGKMMTGWQTIDGKEYFFQPVRNVGNYYFSSDREKWLYSLNSNVPYGAMYTATTTPDGSAVDETGVKVTGAGSSQAVQNGWTEQNGKWYYYENGIMVSNSWRTDRSENASFIMTIMLGLSVRTCGAAAGRAPPEIRCRVSV